MLDSNVNENLMKMTTENRATLITSTSKPNFTHITTENNRDLQNQYTTEGV